MVPTGPWHGGCRPGEPAHRTAARRKRRSTGASGCRPSCRCGAVEGQLRMRPCRRGRSRASVQPLACPAMGRLVTRSAAPFFNHSALITRLLESRVRYRNSRPARCLAGRRERRPGLRNAGASFDTRRVLRARPKTYPKPCGPRHVSSRQSPNLHAGSGCPDAARIRATIPRRCRRSHQYPMSQPRRQNVLRTRTTRLE